MFIYKKTPLKKLLSKEYRAALEIKKIQILNLGSTASQKDYDFSLINDISLNVAFGPQTLSYDYKFLSYYSKYLTMNAIVNINLMPCSLLVDEYENWNSHVKYCYVLPYNLIHRYSIKMSLKAFLKAVLGRCKNEPVELIGDLNAHTLARVNGWKEEFSVKDLSDVMTKRTIRKNIEKNKLRITKIVEICETLGVNCAITALPVSNKLKEFIPQEMYDQCITECVNSIRSKLTMFVDFYNDRDWCDDEKFDECDSISIKYRHDFTNEWLRRVRNEYQKNMEN